MSESESARKLIILDGRTLQVTHEVIHEAGGDVVAVHFGPFHSFDECLVHGMDVLTAHAPECSFPDVPLSQLSFKITRHKGGRCHACPEHRLLPEPVPVKESFYFFVTTKLK